MVRNLVRRNFNKLVSTALGGILPARFSGTFSNRMAHIARWNAVMRENDDIIKRWNEFILG